MINISKEEKTTFIVLALVISLSAVTLHVKDLFVRDERIVITKSGGEKELSLKEYAYYLAEERKVDINFADLYRLTRIPGIGPVLASRIIEQRESFGAINCEEDLLKVKGVGGKKLQKILPFVKFGDDI